MQNRFTHRLRQMLSLLGAILITGLAGGVLLTQRDRFSQKEAELENRFYELLLQVPQGEGQYCFYNSGDFSDPDTYIAHGGGVGDFHYTNSQETVENARQKGFRFIELDLLATTDGHLVAGHSWKDLKKVCGLADADDTRSPIRHF